MSEQAKREPQADLDIPNVVGIEGAQRFDRVERSLVLAPDPMTKRPGDLAKEWIAVARNSPNGFELTLPRRRERDDEHGSEVGGGLVALNDHDRMIDLPPAAGRDDDRQGVHLSSARQRHLRRGFGNPRSFAGAEKVERLDRDRHVTYAFARAPAGDALDVGGECRRT